MTFNDDNRNGVAVIGMAGRFPGASSNDELWRNLCDGVESISFFHDDEISLNDADDLINQPNYVKAKGILDDASIFDADFFNIIPRFAKLLDPQNRIFLEIAWNALENAGYVPEHFDGLISVFAGKSDSTYLSNIINSCPNEKNKFDPFQIIIANEKDYLPTMVSYYLDLKGPSVNVQTACSTSLVAVCHAFDSLMTFQSDMALAGGVSIFLPQKSGYLYSQSSILSKDGHCRPFDGKAQGTVFSNGAGIIVMKRLEDAIKDNDHIYAVVCGAAINNDGAGGKMSFMAPSIGGQASAITMAQESAGIRPETISYIEAHGTATPLGDPIEIEALTQAFRRQTDKNGFCAIGSIKSNIGHLDAAAGIAGLIKTVLALKNRMLPPSINFKTANTNIDFENSPFYVNTKLSKWEVPQKYLCAGVSSFGVGGTNAHVVVEEPPKNNSQTKNTEDQLFVLSAKTMTALENVTRNLTKYLKKCPDSDLADIAYTLQVGRKPFNYRRYIVCKVPDDAIVSLEKSSVDHTATGYWKVSDHKIVFMFSGQGTQHINMGKGLYKRNPIFRDHIDHCAMVLKPLIGFDLRSVLYPEKNQKEEAEKKLNQTSVSQLAIFAIESAIAHLWIDLGVKPDAMIGHSIGEYVAAYLAGVFTLEASLEILVTRGWLMEKLGGGSVIAISTTMDPILKQFEKKLNSISLKTPKIPYLSNVTGTWIKPEQVLDVSYWSKHMHHTVMFSKGIKVLLDKTKKIFIEIGAGNTLCNLISRIGQEFKRTGGTALPSLPHPDQRIKDYHFFLNTIGKYWLSGGKITFSNLHRNTKPHRVALPGYPFEGKKHWFIGSSEHKINLLTFESNSMFHVPQNDDHIASEQTNPISKELLKNFNAQETELENALSNIYKEILGIDRIGIHDDFFEIGGQSLMAAELFAKIERNYGKNLPLSTLYQAPTIAKMAHLLKGKVSIESWTSLVPIQNHGSKRPIFLVHGAEGNVLLYRSLAKHLGSEQPVYGLQAAGLDGKTPINPDFQYVASNYIEEIKKLQNHGPYLLGGYCLGGTIALEMAQQLMKQNEKIGLLAMIEIYNIHDHDMVWPQSIHIKLCNVFLNIWYHFLNTISIDNGKKTDFLKEKLSIQKRRLKIRWHSVSDTLKRSWGSNDQLKYHHLRISKAYDDAFEKYIPEKYPGKIDIFGPKKLLMGFKDNNTYGYGSIAGHSITSHQLPFYPRGSLVEPYVKILASKLKKCIEAAES